MIEDNEQYAYFAVSGDFDPAAITARVGVAPTTCWQRGDVCPRTHRERMFSRWTLHSRLDRNRNLEDHIGDVLVQLGANPPAFAAIAQELSGVMQLVAYFRTDYPGMHFERKITDGLSQYSLAVDFDFYWLYSHRREDTEA